MSSLWAECKHSMWGSAEGSHLLKSAHLPSPFRDDLGLGIVSHRPLADAQLFPAKMEGLARTHKPGITMSQNSEGSRQPTPNSDRGCLGPLPTTGPCCVGVLGMMWWSVVPVMRAERASQGCLLGTGRLPGFGQLL